MRKGNMSILASVLAIALVAAGVGMGTMAYFSDTAESTGNTFTSGTLNLVIKDNGAFQEGLVATWEAPVWAPGESVEATITMRNDGSIGITHIGVKGGNLEDSGSETHDLSDVILLTRVAFTEDGSTLIDIFPVILQYYGMDTNTDEKISLKEFIAWCDIPLTMKFWTGNPYPPVPDTLRYLYPSGVNTQKLVLGFTFDSVANNNYQDLTASFDLSIIAGQSYDQWPPVWVGSPHGY